MKTTWILQNNIYTENLDEMIRHLEGIDRPYKLVSVIPFSDKTDLPKVKGPAIAYGSTSLMKHSKKDWVWYDKNTFKPSVWGSKIGDKYLNSDAKIMKLSEVLDNWTGQRAFIRPNSDFKLFSGDVFMKGDFYDWYTRVEQLIETGTYVNLKLNTEVSVSEYKEIVTEWRFFVVDKKIVAASQYRKNGKLDQSREIELGAVFLADDIAGAEWQLAPGYVVDIGVTKDGEYKVIEFNNFNSAGFYQCHIGDIIREASLFKEREWMR